ncbi:nucleotidyltransferase domain-containing protein [Flindersiella endophytica]
MAADLGQRALIERARQVLGADDRVLGVWIVGSHARGTNDSFSDVDLWVVVGPDDVESFCSDWPKTSDEIAPTVIRRQVGSLPIFNQVTTDWLRFDVSVATPDQIAGRTRSTTKPLHDPNGLSAGLGEPRPPLQPDPERVESITHEFLRVLGLLPVAVGRQEYVVGESGAGLLRGMLIDLMLQDVAVEDRGGALHLNDLLPADRLRTLTDLPPLQATRESVIAANVACATAFLPLARDLHARCGVAWPRELEEAARRHLATALSIELPV